MQILRRLREGNYTDEDISEVQKLVLTDKDCDVPHFSTERWSEAILITPRHAVRERWSEAALTKHCNSTGNRRYIVHVEDRMPKSEEDVPLCAHVKMTGRDDRGAGNLEKIVEIAVGMKVMIVANISTEAYIANGSRGVFEDIFLDPGEQAIFRNEDRAICLKYSPAMVLFKPGHGTHAKFADLPAGLVPITPSTTRFTVKTNDNRISHTKRR
jgi:hypothetical protein